MRLLFELSGEHPGLPHAEVGCLGTIITSAPQVAVAECPHPGEVSRLAQTHVVMEYLGESKTDLTSFRSLLSDLSLSTDRPFACRVKRIHPSILPEEKGDLERMMGDLITGDVSLKNPEEEFRAIFSDGTCYLGRVIQRIERGSYAYRNPMRRPFFHPGVMMPLMARAMVNLTHVRPDEIFYDPFCGTGGILLEAELVGAQTLGSDIDPRMINGLCDNIRDPVCFRADTCQLPIEDGVIDAIATDLPYGQSTAISAPSLERLYDASLSEIRRILKRGGRAVVVTHRDISSSASEYFDIINAFDQRVHKSLTRRILVLA